MRRILALLGLTLLVALVGAQPTLADGTPVLTLPSSPAVVDVENVTSTTVSFSAIAVTCPPFPFFAKVWRIQNPLSAMRQPGQSEK